MDRVLEDFKKEVEDETASVHLEQILKDGHYDTDTMNQDVALYAESKDCNLWRAFKGDTVRFDTLRRSLRYHRVSAASFSTGKWWAYWKWYDGQTMGSVMNQGSGMWDNIDFGGHSMESLCVRPHFESLKDEVFGSGLISARFWRENVVDKAARYAESRKCKKMVFSNHCYSVCGLMFTYILKIR